MAENTKKSNTLLWVSAGIGTLILGIGGYLIYSKFFKTPATVAAPAASSASGNSGRNERQDNSENQDYFGPDEYSYGQSFAMPIPSNLLNSPNIAVCYPPSAVTAISVNGNSVVISWQPAYGASYYNVQYMPSNGTSGWITIPVSGTTSTVLSGLLANTMYLCEVQAICSSGASSFVSTTFITTATTTIGGCTPPTGLTSGIPGINSVIVSWQPVYGATSYNVQYRASTSSTWITIAVSGTSINLTGLVANTAYIYQVQSNCSGTLSSYSSASFTTI